MNIFTTENIAKYNTKNRTAGVGEYVLRNGFYSMDIRPEPFYQNFTDANNNKISYILRNEFLPNTQYIIDLWIDGDDVVYNGNNVACGLTLYYTDGSTNTTTVITGGSRGFQHKKYVTASGKSVRDFNVYYYTSSPVYYRADSYIIPLITNTTKIDKKGIFHTSDIIQRQEYLTPPMSLGKEYILANNFYEY